MWSNATDAAKATVRQERLLAGANDGFCLVVVNGKCKTWIRVFQHFDALDLLENYDA